MAKFCVTLCVTLAVAAVRAETPDPVMLVTDRAALAWLEAHGMTLGERLGGPATSIAADLVAKTPFKVLADQLGADLKALLAEDKAAGVGMEYAHRIFDVRWLQAKTAQLQLIGVVNRMDRAAFKRNDGCGEVRLVYRLAYDVPVEGGRLASRLPLTINLVHRVPAQRGSCAVPARRWVPPEALAGAALAQWLTAEAGPLAGLTIDRLAAVAFNVQQVRWPSSVHRTFGGHSEYLLRRFSAKSEGGAVSLTLAALENTPDVAKLRADKSLVKELVAFLKRPESLAALDQGTLVIPARFLARRSVSVAPRGFERKTNRPWRQVIGPRRFKRLDLSETRTIRSPRALIRRLDALTCAGCHQARSHAGFHLLGEDHPEQALDAMLLPTSPHLQTELDRRKRRHLALLAGGKIDELQPTAELTGGGYGSHCGLPPEEGHDPDPGFTDWACGKGLACKPVGEKLVGACLPRRGPRVGDPCEVGRAVTWLDPRRDRAVELEPEKCLGSRCIATEGGFPLGMCKAFCGASKRVTCGVMVSGGGFSGCLAARQPFTKCITGSLVRAGLKGCDASTPCRDDYLCSRPPGGAMGTCLPPYFLFQLRVDGHPDP